MCTFFLFSQPSESKQTLDSAGKSGISESFDTSADIFDSNHSKIETASCISKDGTQTTLSNFNNFLN